METIDDDKNGMLKELSIHATIHGVGLELLLTAEELMYASRAMDEKGCYKVGSDLYLLATILGSIMVQWKKPLSAMAVKLPDNVGAFRIRNPYYSRDSENPPTEADGQSTDGEDLPPF